VVCALAALLLAAAPARAELHGGIELGAKGIKATVIDATPGSDGLHVKVLYGGTHNSTLVAGVAAKGKFEPAAMKDAGEAVARFATEMEKKYGVPPANIYVVGSSGLFSPIATDAAAVAANRAELAKAVRAASGRPMDFITDRQEAHLSIVGIVPRQFQDTSALIDIGSGNTKGGYRTGPKQYVTFAVPYGSVTFSELARKRFGQDEPVEAGARLSREVVRPALKAALKEAPEVRSRKRTYLSGGACWALATFTRPGDRGSYVALTAKDAEAYHRMLAARPGEYPTPDLSAIADPAARKEAEKDLERVKRTFTPAQLLAGAEILRALSAECGWGEGRAAYFSRHGYLGWVLAYAARKQPARP
jgi:exopolyphosphatase/pppGpp-phosphohydrolase